MKFQADQDALASAVAWVARALPLRPPAPVLAGVLIDAQQDGTVELAAFDYEVSGRIRFDAEVTEPGTALVSGKLLNDIAKALPAKPVTVEVDGAKVKISCDKAKFTLPTMPTDEYPTLPPLPTIRGMFDRADFERAVSQVAIAASRDETVPLLTSIRMEIDDDKVTLLSTDRYRLAVKQFDWEPTEPNYTSAALIKAKIMSDAAKNLGIGGDKIEFALENDGGAELVGFTAGGRQSTSQLIDGEYPPVMRLFPEATPIHAVIGTSALIDAVGRVALVADRNAPIKLNFSEGQVELEAGQGDDAEATEVLPAELVGEDITVAFNPQYLIDGLRSQDSPFVRLSFTHPTKPVVFTGQDSLDGDVDESYRYLLVPIRFAS